MGPPCTHRLSSCLPTANLVSPGEEKSAREGAPAASAECHGTSSCLKGQWKRCMRPSPTARACSCAQVGGRRCLHGEHGGPPGRLEAWCDAHSSCRVLGRRGGS